MSQHDLSSEKPLDLDAPGEQQERPVETQAEESDAAALEADYRFTNTVCYIYIEIPHITDASAHLDSMDTVAGGHII